MRELLDQKEIPYDVSWNTRRQDLIMRTCTVGFGDEISATDQTSGSNTHIDQVLTAVSALLLSNLTVYLIGTIWWLIYVMTAR